MENNHASPSPVFPLANVARDNAGVFAPYFLTLANRNAQGGQGKYNSVTVAGVIALKSTPM